MAIPARPLRVLIADDHAVMRRLFREDLETARIKVRAEAVRAALAERPDLCQLDVRMPHGDGITAAESIRQALPG